MTRYELLQSISQGENGTLSHENEELALITNDIVRATTSCSCNEEKYGAGYVDAVDFNNREQREAEKWAVIQHILL